MNEDVPFSSFKWVDVESFKALPIWEVTCFRYSCHECVASTFPVNKAILLWWRKSLFLHSSGWFQGKLSSPQNVLWIDSIFIMSSIFDGFKTVRKYLVRLRTSPMAKIGEPGSRGIFGQICKNRDFGRKRTKKMRITLE